MGPGSRVAGRYLVENLAGEGGMGKVFRAVDLTSDARVALKVLGERGRAERFLIEAEALASLHHEAIVRYIDHGVDVDGDPYLVMEWLEGEALDARLERVGLTLEQTLRFAERLVLGLSYIHGKGVVHRDLKPSNILFMTDDVRSAKLVDFGVARITSARAVTATGVCVGTPFYMAPEQYLQPRNVDGRADVFALGCILFECLTGRRTFAADDAIVSFARVVLEQAPAVRQFRPDVPEAVDAFVARLLERDRARRPGAAELLLALGVLQRQQAGGLPPVSQLPTRVARSPTASDALSPTAPHVPSMPVFGAASLPKAVYGLIGRVDEVEHLSSALDVGGGIVTLWGPAGVGKTRLALEVAIRWTKQHSHGAVFASLRQATDHDGILRAVALALQPAAAPEGTAEQTERAIERLLRVRAPALLVLDGTEHVAGPLDPLVRRWSTAVPETRLLVTSRERSRGAMVVELGPLSCDGEASPAALLFCARGGPGAHRFLSDSEAMKTVARIVRVLDGNPLAIELAAARVEVLGLGPLLERLARPLEVLGRSGSIPPAPLGDGDVPLTMTEALAWSWALLSDAEKEALARCSVFRGSFTVRAAEGVVGLSSTIGVVDLLQSLRDKSLLTSTPGQTTVEARLSMSAAVRDFAHARLGELGLVDETLARHAKFYVGLAEPLAARVTMRGAVAALRGLESEAEEILSVVEYALAHSPPLAVSALLAIEPVLSTRGPFGAHFTMLEDALAQASTDLCVPRAALVRLRQVRGRLLTRRGRFDEARVELEAVLTEALGGDPYTEASARLDLAGVHHALRNLDEARALYETVACLELESPFLEARALGNLGTLHHDQHRFDDAYACYVEAIALFESLGNPRPIGWFLANLAMLDHDRGRLSDAARHFTRALRYLEDARDPRLLGVALGSLGMLDLEEGHFENALAKHERAHLLLREIEDPRSEALSLGRLGASLSCLDRVEEATAAIAKGERVARRDPVAKDMLRLYRAFLDAARARAALTEGRSDEANAAIEGALARMLEATRGARPLVEHSDDARAILRIVRPLVSRMEQEAKGKLHQKSSSP